MNAGKRTFAVVQIESETDRVIAAYGPFYDDDVAERWAIKALDGYLFVVVPSFGKQDRV